MGTLTIGMKRQSQTDSVTMITRIVPNVLSFLTDGGDSNGTGGDDGDNGGDDMYDDDSDKRLELEK